MFLFNGRGTINEGDMHKPVLIVLGLICVGVAVLGIFLPVLPTTPFLLLALACFAKSSKKLHGWILSNKLLGPFIREWHETRSMSFRAKVYALITIVAGGLVSVLTVEQVWLKVLVVFILVIPVSIILKIKESN